ncbi:MULTISPECIES: DUF4489 domain-containing protein [unclassified Sedimentibacter]|uniref:DUF4489 domain-containing protein n=1 Tax=unclassified Sedimentibacter TaxID=2649220 RepID=UPI0027E03B5D|nr:DUF4489 domain-containing protein [Sedimentibacter sp. MB35-C1]WMJ76491.1 DUF4489 domain-containing protein [Sedimentibacter sp. MB35-C1]
MENRRYYPNIKYKNDCCEQDNFDSYEKDKFDCCKKCPKKRDTILECGIRPSDAIFEIDDGDVEDDQKFVLDRLIVDTTCLNKPIVKIEFSSLIFFEVEDDCGSEHEIEVDLLFKLIRICNGDKQCIQSWRYLYELEIENDIDELEVEMSQPFTVTFCDRPCSDCCEYKMVVEGVDFDGDFDALRVVKPDLSAIAQGYCD